MTNVIPFPTKPPAEPEMQCWICTCGSQEWVLWVNGDCQCLSCDALSGRVKVVERSAEEIATFGLEP